MIGTEMGSTRRSHRPSIRRSNETMRLVGMTFVGIMFGFFIGASDPLLPLTKVNLPSSSLLPSIDIAYIEEKYSEISTEASLNVWVYLKKKGYLEQESSNNSKTWFSTNPRGAERLPPGIVVPESDFYIRRSSGWPAEDLMTVIPKYLVTFTVGYEQRDNIDKAVKKLSDNFTVLLFHYDGRTTEWDEFEWSKKAIHISARKQAKWWYAKRFLHPDIVAPYDYIFIWDEDLVVDNFDPEEYLKLVKKHGLDISQPGLSSDSGLTWLMTRKQDTAEVHKEIEERPGWCEDPHLPPCAAFVEIMAPVFSRSAWRCVWHMIQNDLVHGWGLDFAIRHCVEPAHEKIGVVDAQWIVHASVPSLGNQGEAQNGRAAWEGVRERCQNEWGMFEDRFNAAEKAYSESVEIDSTNSTKSLGGGQILRNV